MSVSPIPEGYHTLTPYLVVDDAAAAIDFYTRAFGAREDVRMPAPDGRVSHAELQIGDSRIMLSDPMEGSTVRPPKELGGISQSIFMYVEDVDASFQQAIDAGATVEMALQDMFWGDRFGSLMDPFGHLWSLSTHKEDLTPEQIDERAASATADLA
jgi:PhnB protein